MRWTKFLVVFALVSCAKSPEAPPEPPAVVVVEPAKPIRIEPADVAALKAEIERSRAKLAAYQALPPCAPSGVVECRDDVRAGEAASAERNADEALDGLHGSRSRLRNARQRARTLRDAVKHLTGD